MLDIDITKLNKLDRVTPRCKVIDLGSGNPPKFVTVQLPGADGARQLARWTGAPVIAVNDYVRIQRRGADGQYDIVGTDGATVGAVKNNYAATADPTVDDDANDGYSVGSVWINVTGDRAFVCLDATATAAVWQRIGAGTVAGPGSSTDNAIMRWDGTAGSAAQNSGVLIDDNNKITLPDSSTHPPLNVTERSSAPSSPSTGDIYLDDGANTASGNPGWRRYTGAAWEDVSAAGGGSTTLTVRNNSGATATAGDCGYLVGRDYYLGTAGNPSQRCIVTTGGANGADIEVQNRGNCTAFYTGSAPAAGNYLKYDSIGALTIDGSTPTADTIAAATAAGSGGSVAVLLMVAGDLPDLYLMRDTYGIWDRSVNYGIVPDEHWSGISEILSWTGWASYTGFATPSATSFAKSIYSVAHSSSALAFRYRSLPGSTPVYLRCRAGISLIAAVGLMMDDGTDKGDGNGANNFVRVLLSQASAGAVFNVVFQHRAGGGSVTTVTSTFALDWDELHGVILTSAGTHWSSWNAAGGIFGEGGVRQVAASVASLSWTPTRVGLVFSLGGGLSPTDRRGLIDWYDEATS